MKIGAPLDRSTQHGPQNHLAHLNKLIEYCQIGKKEVYFLCDCFTTPFDRLDFALSRMSRTQQFSTSIH